MHVSDLPAHQAEPGQCVPRVRLVVLAAGLPEHFDNFRQRGQDRRVIDPNTFFDDGLGYFYGYVL